MNESGYVTLPVEEYTKLATKSTKYSVLINALIRNTVLGYNGELHYDATVITGVLRALDGHLYSARIYELKQEDKRREEERADV